MKNIKFHTMNWYIAKIVFRIISGDGNHAAQFDEQLRVIKAEDDEKALEKAKQIGRQEEDSFINTRNQVVRWNFINIPELNKLPSLADGTEIYSKVHEYENANRFIDTVNRKAENIASSIFKNIREAI